MPVWVYAPKYTPRPQIPDCNHRDNYQPQCSDKIRAIVAESSCVHGVLPLRWQPLERVYVSVFVCLPVRVCVCVSLFACTCCGFRRVSSGLMKRYSSECQENNWSSFIDGDLATNFKPCLVVRTCRQYYRVSYERIIIIIRPCRAYSNSDSVLTHSGSQTEPMRADF